MSPQLRAALLRAGLNGLVAAGVTATGALATGVPTRQVVILTAAAFFAVVASRGAVEGWYDSQRALAGAVLPADVSPTPTGGKQGP